MSLDASQEIRRILDEITAVVNSPEMGREAQHEAIRDFSDQLMVQVKTSCLPVLVSLKPMTDEEGRSWW